MTQRFIGLMSGTSMDSIDAALIDFETTPPQLIATHKEPLSDELRQELLALCAPGFDEINRMGQLDIRIGKLFANAVNNLLKQNQIPAAQIQAIGSHGQTIRHHPDKQYPFTLQIGDPNTIAHATKITTVADFRRKDIAASGQGAPLTPAFHNAIFRDNQEDRIILNLGGIANITHLPADPAMPVIGFDTGPANTLLDAWANKHLNAPHDQNGDWAAAGKIDFALLEILLADPYFQLPYPKSTGREHFNLDWLTTYVNKLAHAPSAQDTQTTLSELTAISIAQAMDTLTTTKTKILVCGGGLHNKHLMQRLALHCKNHSVHSTEEFGLPPEWIECMAFAWLAKQTLAGKTGNLPSVTGATQETILGGIYLTKNP